MAPSENQETIEPYSPSAAGATLVLWFILLAFGGGCLAWYYSSIRYFPDILWEEALSFLGVLSIIGGSLTVTFSLLAFLPGVIWSEVLLSDCQLRGPLRYERAHDDLEPCLVSMWWIIGKPFAIFILFIHMFIFLAVALPGYWGLVIMALGTLLLLVLATMLFMWKVRKALEKWGEIHCRETRQVDPRQHDPSTVPDSFQESSSALLRASVATSDPRQSSEAKYRAAFVASALLSLAALMILERVFGLDYRDPRAYGLALFCVAVVVGANIFVASLFETRRLMAIAVAGLATILLLVVGEWVEGPASLLHKVMRSYGVGESTHYDLIVNEDGGELLAAQGLYVQLGAKGKWGKIRNVAILSRLGDNFFLCSHHRRVSLRRSMVVSWSALESDDAKPAGPPIVPVCGPQLP